jgi:hypothetical protein
MKGHESPARVDEPDSVTHGSVVRIEIGHEVECDRAKRTESAVLVRCNGVWIELRPEEADSELKIAIARLELEAGDILVVKGPIPKQAPDLSFLLPSRVRVLYIPPDVELSVLTKAEIDERAQPMVTAPESPTPRDA